MASVFEWLSRMTVAEVVLRAIAVSLLGISALLCFIVLRRWIRGRYFARRDRQIVWTRKHWNELINGTAPQTWRFQPLASEVVEAMLLDSIEVSQGEELTRLVACLRRSGLLDRRIQQARSAKKWRRREALVMLGRTRALEALPALTEALDASDLETRIAAVRGMGKLALPEAAVPMLLRFCNERLIVPWPVLKNALWSCCCPDPAVLLRHLRMVTGAHRDLLASVLAEIADSGMADELLVMAGDRSPEVRAAAARALAHADPQLALPPLAQLSRDAEWFVRLRAVVALGFLAVPEVIPVLIHSLTDRNRLVRQRAAWGLMRAGADLPGMLRQAVAAGDNYGLQAIVAEMERCGRFSAVLEGIQQSNGPGAAGLVSALLTARSKLGLEQPKPEEAYAHAS